MWDRKTTAASLIMIAASATSAKASIIFDDFNTALGHFNSAASGSGSNSNVDPTSTNTRITSDSFEGTGADKLSIVPVTAGSALRLRHLSGGGTPANNTAFTTSSGTDGWIGLYLKTSTPGYTAQIWIEGPSNNGSIERAITADGAWHLYEWNLDDNAGDANGWGTVTGVVTGVATVSDGSHTIDSVIFRSTSSQSGTILMDFVAKSDSGSIAALVPEPGMLSLAGLTMLGLARRRRR
jgi:hypothetical protein